MKKYICQACGYIYDPVKGDPDNDVPAGTKFEDLPDDWICPVCGVGKDEFEARGVAHRLGCSFPSAFRALQVAAIGVSLEVYLAYEIVFQCATGFHHSNVRLPLFAERLLSRIAVTPRMHGVHHSSFMNEADSNYSVIFMWWDRLHGTLRLNVPQATIEIGVPAYAEARDNSVWRILTMPFLRQREHWPEGTRARTVAAPPADVPRSTMVA